ncbi:MAG: hypothetical protein HY521_15500 [Proteobacteria bacterium]|nr:hypothetical protein [Pseudomonadota bacterium]
MKSIHSKSFADVWNALYHATNPGHDKERWGVDGLEWVRERHGFSGRDHAFRIECHTLTYGQKGQNSWSLLVVVERWWQPGGKDALRTSEWRCVLRGRASDVLAWFGKHKARLDRGVPPAP